MTNSHPPTPSLPREAPCPSYWQQHLSSIANHRSTEDLPSQADIVIVGSGLSGASVAYNILKSVSHLAKDTRPSIVLLEARQAASGASGRNGGHTKGASYRSFLQNISEHGEDEACRIAKLEYDCMTAVHEFARSQGIDCDSRTCDTVDIFYDEDQMKDAKRSVARMTELLGSHPVGQHQFRDAAETEGKFFAENSYGSVAYEAGSVNAYALTTGILRLALKLGLNLQTNTAVTELAKQDNSENLSLRTVKTARGNISTKTVILATNGYTAHLMPELTETIVPFRGVVTAQRPGLALPHYGDLDTTYSFIYKEGYEYMITRPAISPSSNGTSHGLTNGTSNSDSAHKTEYDIVIGGGLTKTPLHGQDEFYTTDDTRDAIPATITTYLVECTRGFYGSHWGESDPRGTVRFTHSGIMGYSADGHPFVGEHPSEKGLWLDVSFQGHGMVLCWLCAKAVSAMVLDELREQRVVDEFGEQRDEKMATVEQWFPQSFLVTEKRLSKKFKGDLVGRDLGQTDEKGQVESVQ